MWGVPRAIWREILLSTKPFGVPTARPIDRARVALWLCYQLTCSWWNAPTNTHCTKCGSART